MLTVTRWLKDRNNIISNSKNTISNKTKKLTPNDAIKKPLSIWFNAARNSGLKLNPK